MKMFFLLGLIGVFLLYGGWRERERFFGPPLQVILGPEVYTLEIADTDEERRSGLGNRERLCEQCAMLFIFDGPGQYAFWMKDMRFSLDIAWLSGNRVVWIERHIASDSTTTYQPDVSADRVLELNAGALDNLSIGEQVNFSSPW